MSPRRRDCRASDRWRARVEEAQFINRHYALQTYRPGNAALSADLWSPTGDLRILQNHNYQVSDVEFFPTVVIIVGSDDNFITHFLIHKWVHLIFSVLILENSFFKRGFDLWYFGIWHSVLRRDCISYIIFLILNRSWVLSVLGFGFAKVSYEIWTTVSFLTFWF